ncbi:hypothetical protein [Neisseria meningitidis]|nr:hypothetical protein [Neisseria meningitidis]
MKTKNNKQGVHRCALSVSDGIPCRPFRFRRHTVPPNRFKEKL